MRSILAVVRTALLLLLVATALEVATPASAVPAPLSASAVATHAAPAARLGCRVPRCYGAISVNPQNGAAGWTYNQPTRYRARRVAQLHCRQSSTGAKRYCVRLIWVRNGCAAAAYRTRDGVLREYAGAYASSKRGAIRLARRKVRGPGAVHTWTWVCTTRR
jgi:hypothetical protein